MTQQNIGNIIVFLIIIIFYGILPIYVISKNIKTILSKRRIRQQSEELLNSKYGFADSSAMIISSIIFLSAIIIMIRYKNIVTSIFLLQGLSMFSSTLLRNRFANDNGIYENGLVIDKFYPWNDIHSFKIIDKGTLSFLLNNGNRVDINAIRKIDIILECLKKNNISNIN